MQSQESEALQARYRLACELAKAGAELAFEYYQQREALTVDHKGDDLQDVVSVADKRVEAFVKQRIQSAFPEDGFLGEESGARLPDARVLWVVDPIDGTSCFLNGLQTWCLSLAIVADGEPVIGVVYDPNHRELFHALRGHGAWLKREVLTGRIFSGSVKALLIGAWGLTGSRRKASTILMPSRTEVRRK